MTNNAEHRSAQSTVLAMLLLVNFLGLKSVQDSRVSATFVRSISSKIMFLAGYAKLNSFNC